MHNLFHLRRNVDVFAMLLGVKREIFCMKFHALPLGASFLMQFIRRPMYLRSCPALPWMHQISVWPNVQFACLLRQSRTSSRCLLSALLLPDARPAIYGSWERKPFLAREAHTPE
jgi:hypothetical protein